MRIFAYKMMAYNWLNDIIFVYFWVFSMEVALEILCVSKILLAQNYSHYLTFVFNGAFCKFS